MKILITGTAGFIGYHLALRLLDRGDEVVGIDNINDYYDVNLKYSRLANSGIKKIRILYGQAVQSTKYPGYKFYKLDLNDKEGLNELFNKHGFDVVINLAAQAGVRYSLKNPQAYIDSNISGFLNILENCRIHSIKNLLYASSSSVYGLNKRMPFSVTHNVDHPVSLYAASKKSNELMAHAYSNLFNIPTTGLRFFTVYGPWGRPDMALYLFTKAILEGKAIDVFNNGELSRDFTYIDDIIEGIVKVVDSPAKATIEWDGYHPDPASSPAPYQLLNIGRGEPVKLLDFITELEDATGRKAKKNYLPMQKGDVSSTWADIRNLEATFGYEAKTSIKQGIKAFITWFNDYYYAQEKDLELAKTE
ncbi:NAD-dependent epimerase [Desertivirga arenae]|uniref:NAD-dependent epimerase n=1 Tax=Desertivirga arenae TaxID=2810309 RepID=UPI001A963C85|nr:NAD-dependent epimerase [Pedobacter sp. SYSU D00823]